MPRQTSTTKYQQTEEKVTNQQTTYYQVIPSEYLKISQINRQGFFGVDPWCPNFRSTPVTSVQSASRVSCIGYVLVMYWLCYVMCQWPSIATPKRAVHLRPAM